MFFKSLKHCVSVPPRQQNGWLLRVQHNALRNRQDQQAFVKEN